MAERPDNPPAFPSVCMDDPGHPASIPGMLLRDYFAGPALAGLCGAVGRVEPRHREPQENADARWAYARATAMLIEREKANG